MLCLDYCNTMLAGILASTLAPLQRMLSATAHLMIDTVAGNHIGNVMWSLYWLLIAY